MSSAVARRPFNWSSLLVYAILLSGAIVICLPLVWMILTALSPEGSVNHGGLPWPREFHWDNFHKALTKPNFPFMRFALNTITITFFCIIGTVTSSALVAYAFARLRFRGRNILFMLVLSTVMIPYQVTMIPRFLL